MESPVQQVRDLWRAHERGGVEAFLAAAGEDVVWQPYFTGDRVFRNTGELREAIAALEAEGVHYKPVVHDLEQHGNVVLVNGILRVAGHGRSDEKPLHWAYHFRSGRLERQSSYPTRADALEAISALRVLADLTFSLDEEPGGGGERIVRLRGELDIHSAPELERALLRERSPGSRLILDLGGLSFMDSTGLRVLLRARTAADEGGWQIRMRNVPSTIRRLFDMTGVQEALPTETS